VVPPLFRALAPAAGSESGNRKACWGSVRNSGACLPDRPKQVLFTLPPGFGHAGIENGAQQFCCQPSTPLGVMETAGSFAG